MLQVKALNYCTWCRLLGPSAASVAPHHYEVHSDVFPCLTRLSTCFLPSSTKIHLPVTARSG